MLLLIVFIILLGVIISRQKNRVSFFSINDTGENVSLTLENAFKQDNKLPYFSIGLHKKLFCTTTADRKLEVFDILAGR